METADCHGAGDQEQEREGGDCGLRQGYNNLLDTITGHEEEVTEEGGVPQLMEFLETNESLYKKVAAPQEAVMDARVIKQLSRLCRKQADKLSANISEFSQQEYAEKLVNNMTGGSGAVSRRKWVLLGQQVQGLFRKSPPLTYLYGALDTVPIPPKERKERRTRQATKIADLVATKETVLLEAEQCDNQTEQMVTHVFRCLVTRWKETRAPVSLFHFAIDPESFGASVENLFHIAFLVKEGKVAVSVKDGSGLPQLEVVSRKRQESQESQEEKNQAGLAE